MDFKWEEAKTAARFYRVVSLSSTYYGICDTAHHRFMEILQGVGYDGTQLLVTYRNTPSYAMTCYCVRERDAATIVALFLAVDKLLSEPATPVLVQGYLYHRADHLDLNYVMDKTNIPIDHTTYLVGIFEREENLTFTTHSVRRDMTTVMDGMKDPVAADWNTTFSGIMPTILQNPLSSGVPSAYKQDNDAFVPAPSLKDKGEQVRTFDMSSDANTAQGLYPSAAPASPLITAEEEKTALERQLKDMQQWELYKMRTEQVKLGTTEDAVLRALRKELVDEALRDMGLKPWHTPLHVVEKAGETCGLIPGIIKRDARRCLCWNNNADYVARPCGHPTLCALCFSEYEKHEQAFSFCPKCYAPMESNVFKPALIEDDPEWFPLPDQKESKPEDVLTLEDMMDDDAEMELFYDEDVPVFYFDDTLAFEDEKGNM
jgi:hypothetical protein